MGYELHITRQKEWHDENADRQISLGEWKAYVANDPEMRMDNFAEAHVPGQGTLRIEDEGFSVWTAYSADGVDGNHAWIWHSQGNICAKNPAEEIIKKMLVIADVLQAKVQGDDGEIYGVGADDAVVTYFEDDDVPVKAPKPWWKFW